MKLKNLTTIDCSETVRIESLDTNDFYNFVFMERNYFLFEFNV